MRVLGAVLTGGRSSRFGSDKATALWRGRALVDHAWDALAAVCDATILCGRSYTGRPYVPDADWAGAGPLAGIVAALHHARENGLARVVTVPCDMPTIPRDLVAALACADAPLIFDAAPVVGAWPADLAEQLEDFLRTDRRRSVRGWAAVAGAGLLTGWSPPNINHPDDLHAIER